MRIDVHPYDKVSWVIEEAGYISVGRCSCRVIHKHCDHLIEACLIFDDFGRFLTERGVCREITKQEAKDVLQRCEDEGLIHTTNNAQAENPVHLQLLHLLLSSPQGVVAPGQPNGPSRDPPTWRK